MVINLYGPPNTGKTVACKNLGIKFVIFDDYWIKEKDLIQSALVFTNYHVIIVSIKPIIHECIVNVTLNNFKAFIKALS